MKHMSALSPFNPACQHIFIPHRCDLSLSHTCTASYSSHADLVSKRVAASSWLVELLMDKHQLTSLTFYSHTSSAGTKTKGHQALLNAGCMWSLMQCICHCACIYFPLGDNAPKVLVFTTDGDYLMSWNTTTLEKPHGIFLADAASSNPTVWITDVGNGPYGHCIKRYTPSGKLLQVIWC